MNKYGKAERNPNGPGDARVTALQIVKDNDMEGKLAGKVVLITGTSSGIGIETVRAMAATGATIFCAARDEKKNKDALSGISGKLELLKMDLTSFESVRAAAKEFLERSGGKLNILIDNAGVMAIPERQLTKDGFEMHLGTNHLAHFLLFQLVKSALLASSTPEFNSRVICLTSSGHRASGIHFDNYNLDGEYDMWVAYGQAKTANLYMANEIERKYGSQGLHGLAVHPGNIATPLQKHVTQEQWAQWSTDPTIPAIMKSTEQGAATTLLAAIGKHYEGVGGRYLEDVGEWGPVEHSPIQSIVEIGYESWAFDQEKEERLWKDSCKMVGVKDE
ncbi:NAD(P)-binding protein [Rhizodiscina lignyota]|uniref:NAD(P)-binding protein n=1 Tax=Rhizodiscina lignyota TaxID=1504668 RepID=A0A9P4IEG5_9PEZI|nr:NAD(P)-binding protein [Rhizodiscina lignyota]